MVSAVGEAESKGKKWAVQYPNILSHLRTVPHKKDIPVTEAPEFESDDGKDNEISESEASNSYDQDLSLELSSYL